MVTWSLYGNVRAAPTADASAESLRIAVLGSDDLGREMCDLIADDVTDHPVTWKNDANLASLQGQTAADPQDLVKINTPRMLCQNVLHHISVDISQAKLPTGVAVRELLVIESQ